MVNDDDDKQLPEQDPWAGLDIDGEARAADASAEVSGEDIPLVVFPPADAEADPVDAPVDALGDAADLDDIAEAMPDVMPGIISMSEAAFNDPADGIDGADTDQPRNPFQDETFAEERGSQPDPQFAQDIDEGGVRAAGDHAPDDHDRLGDADDAFDDAALARELGLMDGDNDDDRPAVSAWDAGLGFGESAEQGDVPAENSAEDVALDAAMTAEELSPFADSEAIEPVSGTPVTGLDDSSSLPVAAAAAGGALATAAKPVSAKKKGGGLGQLVGVAMGGLMALPITYAILIWGFHKDPFKFGRQMPPQLAFLLPQKLQPGYKPPKKAGAGPNLSAATSLDDLPAADEIPGGAPAEAAAAGDGGDAVAGESTEPATAPPADGVSVAASVVDPAASSLADAAAPAPEPAAEPATEPAKEAVHDNAARSDNAAAVAEMPAASLAPSPVAADGLSGLDAIVADAAVPAPVAVVAVPAESKPPLDLARVEGAADRVAQAEEALNAIADPSDPERDRRLVVWYRRLTRLGEELVQLETQASDSGNPLAATPATAAELLDRICVSETAVADLDRLDGMWLSSQSPRADGVTLIAVLGAARRVGPYWSTTATISGGNADGSDRSVAIISRLAPPADTGDRVLVSGIRFDGNAVWAADMRPVAPEAMTDAESDASQEVPAEVGPPAE